MKKLLITMALLLCTTGCGNLSPRINPELQEEINNQGGKIEELENLQNSMKNEILKNNQRLEGELQDVQQGMINLQGIQILSGPAGLGIAACLMVIGLTIWYYREQAKKNEKIVNILTETIKGFQNPVLEEEVLKAAMFTAVEEDIYNRLYK